ncbi:MAG: 5'/3'-nucleotidase SurE [candidate division Zixibacteria bacterium]|nr:5'/3'-nucleotidase SurE [Candidatus Tariuqbacter arcticus]
MQKPLILLSNDDGIFAPGLYALYEQMVKLGEVKVVAPDSEQSAVGHAITLRNPLRAFTWMRFGEPFGTAVIGTPADCIKLALAEFVDRKPDLVVSGINQGANTGVDILYSGTVSAATEGAVNRIPSIAISLTSFTFKNFQPSADFILKLAQKVLENGLPVGTFLNVNVPPLEEDKIKGYIWTRQGLSRYVERFEKRYDPKGRPYYWMDGDKKYDENSGCTDDKAIADGFISISPVHYDLTDHNFIEKAKDWNLNLVSNIHA